VRHVTEHIVVDDTTIAEGDVSAIIHPVWWLSKIYDGPGLYEESLRPFSRPQRLVKAIILYDSEINNCGHDQFYSNSSGIVWRDALAGFEAIGLPQAAHILSISAQRLGGDPSLDRAQRDDQMELHQPVFEDLDNSYYDLMEQVNLDELLIKYIRSCPSDFYFSGMVESVRLPNYNQG
jgi:hypothetical protein